ncbi:MAG: shikimate dehydrogenase family protein [Bacteroidia bacterium]
MRHFGLIGYPLSHSFSKNYFTEKFQKGNIDADYINIEIENLTTIDFVKQHKLSGFNVTIPHKQNIIPFLNEVDEEAKNVGAVNTVKVLTNGDLIGYNTDVFGFRQSIKPFLESQHERALILGTGGASKAVSYVLKNLGIYVLHASRNPKSSNEISYADVNEFVIKAHKLIVNTTPLGMFPNVETYPEIPYQYMSSEHLLYDLVYNPQQATFLLKGKEQGATIMNGISMLHLQAEKAWEIWNE